MSKPGEVMPSQGSPIQMNQGRKTERLLVRNTGDRAVQVGSHYHFFEANRALEFERPKALGMRLDIPSGTAVRFEPGAEQEVVLVSFAGTRRVVGFAGLVGGSVDARGSVQRALEVAGRLGFKGAPAVGPGLGSDSDVTE